MIDFIKRLFGFSAKPVEAAWESNQVAPYKVPEPAATTPIPLVVETPAPIAEKAPAKPKGSAIGAAARGPAAPKAKAPAKAVVKAPAKPRATKAKPQA
jgi:hypothetical protein